MSFNSSAAKVRDRDLPFRRRVGALHACVRFYAPLGHVVTLSLLTRLAGPYQKDEAALMRALDLLVDGRAARLRDQAAYAERRTAAKLAGRRVPTVGDRDPVQDLWWHADPRGGALHALWYWRTKRFAHLTATGHPVVLDLRRLMDECLATGRLDPAGRRLLDGHVAALRRAESFDLGFGPLRDLLTVARHLATADDSAPA
ncbi:hypothetical protein AB0M43_22920 [Longispora sp. NPDC051575]|uniref:hypothetical protein n=1 Tax=Longispora sp. NPDC051575 TaxID=3154943 RepID=UPI003421E8A7